MNDISGNKHQLLILGLIAPAIIALTSIVFVERACAAAADGNDSAESDENRTGSYANEVENPDRDVANAKKKKKTASSASRRAAKSGQNTRTTQAPAGAPNKALDLQHQKSALPQSRALKAPAPDNDRSLGAVKPPRSNVFYESGSKEAEYEHLVDEEIKALYKLSQQNRTSPNRGEIWLRLGERYVEKSRLVEFRAQAEYDKKLKDFADKKTGIRPRLDQKTSHEYNQKAVQLYEWFVKDFPKDPKIDQALFFLGYNQFELGNTAAGEAHYDDLVARFPNSVYVSESHFALGEFYFENEQWKKALAHYEEVIRAKRARLNTFALYKSSWCLYRLGRVNDGMKSLERVIRMSRATEGGGDNISGRRTVNRVRLANEALKDYVPFFAEAGSPQDAPREFARLSGDEKQTQTMLEKLAFIYADSGNRTNATTLFKQLISMNPSGERAADYQYQVVLANTTADQKEFRKELEIWLDSFGPTSFWAKENAKNTKLVSDVAKLQESTLRNNVLQLHQTAQNSHAEYTQKTANAAYAQYLKYFPNSPQMVEMQFFHAELLFDMQRYEDAAKVYLFVAERDTSGKYKEKAIVNSVLALEKSLPDPQAIAEKRGKSLEKMPLDPPVAQFEKAAQRYIQTFPKGEKTSDIRRRLGVLYYSYNHFDEARDIFEGLLREDPKSQNAEIAGNLLLDMYKVRGDMIGYTDKAQLLLAIPSIANSKFGAEIKANLEKAGYVRAEKIAEMGDSLKAAKEFEAYANTFKLSELATAARFKAAQNYEKAGDILSAIRLHNNVIQTPTNDPKLKSVQTDSRNALARIYQQTGQLDQAAKQYEAYAVANPKDAKAVNGYFNAGVLWESLGEENAALKSYQTYFDQSRSVDRSEAVFAMAEIYKKKGSRTRATTLFNEYLKSGTKNEGRLVQANFELAEMAQRADQKKTGYQKTVEAYRRASKNGKDAGAKFAADARFRLAQETLAQLRGVRFTNSDKQQARAAGDIKTLREKYISEMKEVILFDNAPFIIAALTSSGQMFEGVAQTFSKVPVPAGYSTEDGAKYRELLQPEINRMKAEARTSYKAAVDRSLDLEVYNEWTTIARGALAALDPAAKNADIGEIASDAKSADWMGL